MVNRKRSWFESLADETEFLEADFVDFRYLRHVHETFAIGVIERGAQRFATKSGETVMPARTLCVVDPDVVHWGWPATDMGWRYRMFYPSHRVIAEALDVDVSAAERLGFGDAVIDDVDLFNRFETLHRCAAGGDRFGLDEAVLTFVADLFTRHAPDTPQQPVARSSNTASMLRDFVQAHVFDAVSLTDFAAAADVSQAHASRTFRREFGMSPYAYLLALRVERSKALLVAGVPIAEAAVACGFHDQSHYHRTFKRIVGVTPGNFAHPAN